MDDINVCHPCIVYGRPSILATLIWDTKLAWVPFLVVTTLHSLDNSPFPRGGNTPQSAAFPRGFWLVCGAGRDADWWHSYPNPTRIRRNIITTTLTDTTSARNRSIPRIRVNCVLARLCSVVTTRNAASSQTGTQASLLYNQVQFVRIRHSWNEQHS